MKQSFHPDEADHDVISKRYVVVADKLPEETAEQIADKKKKLEEEKNAAETTADLDLLEDKTDMSMVKVYENAEKTRIFPNRERQIDKELRAKGQKIADIIARLEGKKDVIKETSKQVAKSTGDSFTTVIRASSVKSASDYLKNTGARKKSGRRKRKVGSIASKGSHR